jgi:hypothetical protein
MSIKDACRLGMRIIAKLSKAGCIPLDVGGKTFHTGCKHD